MKKIILFVMFINMAFAGSALKGDISFEQEDGSTFIGSLKGDEWFSWIEDKKGKIIKYNINTKNYEYAMLEVKNNQVNLIPSGIKVVDSNESNTTINSSSGVEVGKIDKKTLSDIWNERRNKALSYKAKGSNPK